MSDKVRILHAKDGTSDACGLQHGLALAGVIPKVVAAELDAGLVLRPTVGDERPLHSVAFAVANLRQAISAPR